jgi:hypothetical protein
MHPWEMVSTEASKRPRHVIQKKVDQMPIMRPSRTPNRDAMPKAAGGERGTAIIVFRA